jgi:hypothetical protein
VFKKLSVLLLSVSLFLCLTPVARADFSTASKNLSNSPSTASLYPKVVRIPGTGNVLVTWIEETATESVIWKSKSTDNGATWSTPSKVTNGQILYGDWAYDFNAYSLVYEAPYLHLVFQWRANDSQDFEIYYARSSNFGDTWDVQFFLTNNDTDSIYPDVDARGEYVHISYQDHWPGNWDIMYKRINGYGAGTVDQNRRMTYSSTTSCYPRIAVSPSGITVDIVYEDYESTYQIYFKNMWDYGAGDMHTYRLTSGSYWNGLPDIAFSTAASPNDQYVYIVYNTLWPGNREIMYKRLTLWGQPGFTTYTARLTYSATDSYCNSLAFDGALNNIHITYHDDWPGNNDVMYRKLTSLGGAGFTGQRISWGPGDSINAAVADSGNWAHIVWSDDSSGNYEIYWKYGY